MTKKRNDLVVKYQGEHYRMIPDKYEEGCDDCDYIKDPALPNCPLGTKYTCNKRHITFRRLDPLYQDLLKVKEMSK